jgi:uncharacterized protein involved in exopolysaccharide biosynthesis
VANSPSTAARRVDPSGRPTLDPGGSDEPIDIRGLLAPFARHAKGAIAVVLAFTLALIGVSFLVPARYTAALTLTAENGGERSMSKSFAGLMALAGTSGILGGRTSPDFYAHLATSRTILESLLATEFTDPKTGQSRKLIDILDRSGKTPEERMGRSVEFLRKRVATGVDNTGVITIAVTQSAPGLAANVANRLAAQLNQFNIARLQFQSRAEREFAEERLQAVEAELRTAERQQLDFLQHNREYRQSPLLANEAERLDRAVRLRQEQFVTVNNAYQEARINEVRDTPVLTIIDAAMAPYKRSFPRRSIFAVGGVLIGLVAAVLLVRRWESGDRRASDPAALAQI